MRKLKIVLIISALICVGSYTCYRLDKKNWMIERVKKSDWKYDEGYYFGDFIYEDVQINGDTIICNENKKCLLMFQYFDFLYIKEIDGDDCGVYSEMGT